MSLVIHAFPFSPRGFKVLAVANQLGLDYEFRLCDLAKGDQKLPAFVALNPNARMPVLEDGDFALWESNAILQYLAEKKPEGGLLPVDARGRADVMRWMFWDSCSWDPACATYIFENLVKPFFGRGEADPAELEKVAPRFEKFATVLDDQLKTHQFITGDNPTIADFTIAAPLNAAEEAKMPLAPYANIRRWYGDMASLPAWKKTLVVTPPRTA
jgi:glutathione S-transferase